MKIGQPEPDGKPILDLSLMFSICTYIHITPESLESMAFLCNLSKKGKGGLTTASFRGTQVTSSTIPGIRVKGTKAVLTTYLLDKGKPLV